MSMKPPRIVDIGVAGGAPTVVLATVSCKRWKVRESLVAADGVTGRTPQGFQIQASDNSTNHNQSSPVYGPIQYRAAASLANEPGNFPEYVFPESDDASFHAAYGTPVANGPGVIIGVGVTPALPLFQALSLTATATSLEVIEEF